MKRVLTFILIVALFQQCKNRSLTESEEFKPREIHENISFHFDKIDVDGVEYLILEKDNNNPHEGFGFMAFRANKLLEKQDSLLAYNQSILEMQSKIYAELRNISSEQANQETQEILTKYLEMQMQEITTLEETDFSGNTNVSEEQNEED